MQASHVKNWNKGVMFWGENKNSLWVSVLSTENVKKDLVRSAVRTVF